MTLKWIDGVPKFESHYQLPINNTCIPKLHQIKSLNFFPNRDGAKTIGIILLTVASFLVVGGITLSVVMGCLIARGKVTGPVTTRGTPVHLNNMVSNVIDYLTLSISIVMGCLIARGLVL